MDTEQKASSRGWEEKVQSLQETQRAALNILEDFEAEKRRLETVQRATLNLLEDFDVEKGRLEAVQRASLNLLEDFDGEKKGLVQMQRATLNILEDFTGEKTRLEDSQRALLNILDDIGVEKARVKTAYKELEATNQELEAFTYSVAHDLRAPLRHIDGFSRLVLEEHGAELSEAARHQLSRVREGTRQMGQLVDDLLSLSRVGRKQLALQVTGLRSLVEEVLRDLKPDLKDREVEWRIGQLPFVVCDPALIKQVFQNLLSNAVKFTRPCEQAVIEVGTVAQDDQPAVFVRDNGVGFSMKYADKLFGIFQRLHRQEDFEGTGIGLATVQRIIHKHGGRIWAEAELDKGATFYFTLGAPEGSGPGKRATSSPGGEA